MKKLRMIDPQEIIAVVVLLIVLGVGVYAFFVTNTAMVTSGTITPRGNYGTTATRTIHDTTGYHYINVSSLFGNVSTAVQLEAYNTSTSAYEVIQAVGAANGTFMHENLTYRVAKRSVAGEVWWTWFRITYSVNGSATSTANNQTSKSLNNNSVLGGTVFNIIGIVITISAILSIVTVIYTYVRPR